MSRRADCYDNAPMESFFHTLKTELVHHQHYATREEARRDIFAYIEGFYNRTRRHSAIGYLSPIEMELKAVYLCPFFRGKINGSAPSAPRQTFRPGGVNRIGPSASARRGLLASERL